MPRIVLNIIDEEESKYEGVPLIKPKRPYTYKVKTFEPKSEWTKLQRLQHRLWFILGSIKEYCLDIVLLRTDPFIFKTAEFCKRNYTRLKTML